MKLTFRLLFIAMFLSNCKAIIMKVYKIKSPEIENKLSILKSANRYKLDTTNIFTVSSEYYLKKLKESDGIPNAAVYDAKGNYIEYRKTDTSCNAGLFEFIPKLKLDTVLNYKTKETLQNELTKFRDLDGNILVNVLDKNYDFYILIFNTVWTGNLNKDHVKVWEDLAKNNMKSKIKVFTINLDIQEYWNKNEQEIIIKKLEGK